MKMKALITLSLCLFMNAAAQAEIKNAQNILDGLLTRAGATNRKPLSQSDLQSLCERGYTEAFFLYGGAGNQTISCSRGTMRYQSAGDFRKPENMNKVLENIESGMRSREKTFVHCNNGAHASGFVGAIALRTFCGMSAEDAVRYWDKTLGGYPLQEPNRSSLMKRIRNYPIRKDLELSEGQKASFGCGKY